MAYSADMLASKPDDRLNYLGIFCERPWHHAGTLA
jgi:hypothetical protein